jgi:hypothetical protein
LHNGPLAAAVRAGPRFFAFEPVEQPTQIEQRKCLAVVGEFPWPITDDELILNNALAIVMNRLAAGDQNQERLPVEEAAELIVEAYNQGIREPDKLAHHALKALRADGPTAR